VPVKRLALCLLACVALHVRAQPAEVKPGSPQASSSIGYRSVAEAMQALRKRGDVTFEEQKNGWLLALESGTTTSWTFVPRNHLAYPAVVKRTLVDFGGGDYNVLMSILCEGRVRACEELTADFNARNAKIRDEIVRERDKQK